MRGFSPAIVVFLVACGGAAPPASTPRGSNAPPAPSEAPAASPEPAPPAPAPADPFAIQGVLREETLAATTYEPITTPLEPAPKGLAAPPAACAAFASRRRSGKRACDLSALDDALIERDAAKRDTLLVDLESCAAVAGPGVIRALRAELAPLACGDVLTGPLVGKKEVTPEIQHTLAGLAIAARLARSVDRAPRLAPPFDSARVIAFIKGPLKDWMAAQAALTQDLSARAAHLAGYGVGVAAIEAGMADLRLVDAIRAVPLPDSMAKDAELKGVYESALDQMLEPRKDRGRDAALVGMKQLAAVGIVSDDRVTRARTLLGQMYAGRRIDALDALLVPPLPSPGAAGDVSHRLAAHLPTFYVGVLVDPKNITDKNGLAAMIPRGVPQPVRVRLKADTQPDDVRLLVAQEHLAMARAHWRSLDVDEAAGAAKSAGGDAGKSPDAEMLLAIALALRGGPEDAAQMMRRPLPEGLGIGDVAALDAVVKNGGPYAGIASFDGAWLKRISAPRDAGADYWRAVAARFRAAEGLLTDPAAKARASDAAREATAIATATATN